MCDCSKFKNKIMSYCLADALLWKYEYFAVLLLLFDVYLH